MMQNILPSLILYPAIGGLLCLIFPDKLKGIAKALSFIITLGCFAGSIYIFMIKPVSWQIGANRMLIADNLSAFTALSAAFFAFLISLYSSTFIDRAFGRYFGYLLMSLGATLGAAFAGSFVVLLLFWGALAALLYLMVNLSNTEKSSAASKKALIIIGGTDALMIFGIALVWFLTGTFSMESTHIPLNNAIAAAAFLSLLAASFAKAGVMPFHSWLPDVAESAPTPVSAYLPASLDKLLGIYLLARIVLDIFAMNSLSNLILLITGSITIIFAVTIALVQHDLKRLLGYHAVSQVGYMVLGIGTGNPIGIAGGLFHMLNNTIYKSCLFLTGGAIEKRANTSDLDKMGGLAKYMPVTFAACLIASLAISGVPPFNGFVSKWMIYQGILESARPKDPSWILWLVAAMFGSALTIASFMKLLHAAFMGRSSRDHETIKEVGLSMSIPMVVLSLLCVIFGVFAFSIPLSIFIMPAIGRSIAYIGIWDPTMATLLLIAGLLLGAIVYMLSRKGAFRSVKPFVGGEEPENMGRISGVDFYNTIKSLALFRSLYKKEEGGAFDIYSQSGNLIKPFTKVLQVFHNGILPTYMVWCLLGMVGMFLIIFLR